MLKSVLRDWNDEQALAILQSCRAAVTPNGRVLVFPPHSHCACRTKRSVLIAGRLTKAARSKNNLPTRPAACSC
ncbi:hypothetical protein CWO89_12965 [Bradyrhizobium sp. Leo170]|nr:hypothetical protein CWO89_12965 [Bradyrhizobium sp. Leo170]